MRPKIVWAAGLGASLALLSFFFFKKEPLTLQNPEISKDLQEIASRSNSVSLRGITPPTKLQSSNHSTEQFLSAQANSMDERIIELTELGARNDTKSFQKIIASLQDADPEIRQAARYATIQFGSRDAIPILKELSSKTENSQEKMELIEAAKFLELPSLSEIRRLRRTNPSKP